CRVSLFPRNSRQKTARKPKLMPRQWRSHMPEFSRKGSANSGDRPRAMRQTRMNDRGPPGRRKPAAKIYAESRDCSSTASEWTGAIALRIAVVSPSVDRFHGTERAVSELLRRLAYQEQDIVDLFSQRVTDIRLSENSDSGTLPGLFWHRVPALPG